MNLRKLKICVVLTIATLYLYLNISSTDTKALFKINNDKILLSLSQSSLATENNKMTYIRSNGWELLSDYLVIRHTSIFYYKYEGLFKVMIICSDFNKVNISALVSATDYNGIEVNNSIEVEFKQSKHIFDGKAYLLIGKVKDQEVLNNAFRIGLTFVDNLLNKTSNHNFDVIIKESEFKNSFINTTTTAICSYFYHINESTFDEFKWWIKINEHAGYNKIIIFNHSIVFDGFNEFLSEHSDILVVMQFNLLPVLVNNKFQFNNFKNRYDIKDIYLYEIFAYNECILRNYLDYTRIAVMDSDELILPHDDCDSSNYEYQLNKCFSKLEEREISFKSFCNYKVNPYFDYLKEKYYPKTMKSESYFLHFQFYFALGNDYLNNLINHTRLILSNAEVPFKISTDNNPVSARNYKFNISNECDRQYASNILRLYDEYGKEQKNFGKSLNNSFNRIFILNDVQRISKTVYDFNTFHIVNHHHNNENMFEYLVPAHLGFVLHFRKIPHTDGSHKFENNYKDLSFYMNYFNCYLKEINSILG